MIDWQLQVTFDNLLRFSIYRLSYSTLFMSTTVCSSTLCHIFCCFQLLHVLAYIQWQPFTYIYQYVFTHHCYVCMPSAYFLCRFCSSLFAFAGTPYGGFFRGFVVAYLAFFTPVFKTFCCRFSVFQQFQYYLLYICIIPTWHVSTSDCYITCIYTDNLYCSLIYCNNFLMV